MMISKKGSISVEALIVIPVIILVGLFFFQIISLFADAEIQTQNVYNTLEELENINFVYEKVGVSKISLPLGKYQELVDDIIKQADGRAREGLLKEIFINKLPGLTLESWQLKEGLINGQVSYKRNLLFSNQTLHIHFTKRLWLFGDNKALYPNISLADAIKKSEDKDKKTNVYQTKTGAKYHLDGCFYLRRSTTDKTKIIKMTLHQAKKKGLDACKRCIKGAKWYPGK